MTRNGRDREDLRSTIDAIGADAVELAAVEGEKQDLDPDAPRMKRLSQHAVELASRLQRATLEERAIVDDEEDAGQPGRPH